MESIEHSITNGMKAERIDETHVEHLIAIYQDPKVMATLGGVQSEANIRAGMVDLMAHWREHRFGLWAFFDQTDGNFVGRGGLRRLVQDGAEETEIAYAIVANKWGCGFATQIASLAARIAFDVLDISNVVAFTLPDNLA
ncbi:MAG: GNAT family N-acetyltransferase, partial [Planctomycetes bacterium]|nr:GNAT family N-acetyltransferase [Planctomycetota bacterium]